MSEVKTFVPVRFLKLALLSFVSILSAICASSIIYYLIKVPSFRQRFPNQILFLLVFIVSFELLFNIPTVISYLARGSVLIPSIWFCQFWQAFGSLITASIIWCEAIFTLQRYILVFHPNRLRSLRQQIILHYIPLLTINGYLILFYFFGYYMIPCTLEPNYDDMTCGVQCLDNNDSVSWFNWVFNTVFPMLIIIVGSLFLLVRVLWKRREMQRNLRNWSRNQKMIIQLLGIAVIYLVVWLPVSMITLFGLVRADVEIIEAIEYHWYFITYLCEVAVPIIVLLLSPEVLQRLRGRFRPNNIDVGSVTVGRPSSH